MAPVLDWGRFNHTEYAIFGSTREGVKQGLALDNPSLHHSCKENCFGCSALSINAHLAYRFNQALTLAFLNAYGTKVSEDKCEI